MNRSVMITGVLFLVAVLVFSGCIQQIDRPGTSPTGETPAPTLEPTPVLTPEPTPTLAPTPTPTLEPTPTATPQPTPRPLPTPTPAPAVFLDLIEPAFGGTVRTKTITVAGLTVPGTTIEVGSELVRVDLQGRFETQVTLNPGQNVIEVLATGINGGKLRDFVFVTYNPPPPPPFFLLVDQPANLIIVSDQPIRVSGRTIPQATVTVNGVAVPVNEEGQFSTMVALEEGSNVIQILALGTGTRTLRDTRSVLYSP